MSTAPFDIIRSPVVTEKSTNSSEQNKVIFKVSLDADKPAIKKAVEELFGVKVANVNTVKVHGKTKRFRGNLGKRQDYKKAVVTLLEGESLDVMAGVKK